MHQHLYLPWGQATERYWTSTAAAEVEAAAGAEVEPTREIATPLTIRRAMADHPHHAVDLARALVDGLTTHSPDSPALTEARQLLADADHAAAAADWTRAMTDRAARYEQHARTAHGPGSPQAAQWAQLRQRISGPDPWGAVTELSIRAAHVHQDAGDVTAARELAAAAAQTQPRAADPGSYQAELDALQATLG